MKERKAPPRIIPERVAPGRKHLSMEEWRRLLAVSRRAGVYEHALIRTLYETGMRASEPGDLVFDHLKRIHEEPPQLYVPRGKGSVTGWQDISDDLADLLWEWTLYRWKLSHNLTVREVALTWPHAPVFPGRNLHGTRRGITRKTVWARCRA